jgi:gliding motility-associated-like protein
MFKFIVSLFVIVFCSSVLTGQNLIINEISQGPSGAKEYVELVVNGTATCQPPVPCFDLRGLVFDDNNGYFSTGSGAGIATGAMRFANIPFWSCIPQGTIIVIYNHEDMNSSIPPDDLSMNDGNCVLVIPVNSMLLEGTNTGPSIADLSYPANANWAAGSGSSSFIGMANSGDSFQIRSSITDPIPDHAVSWGNNTSNAQIYFPGASGLVFSFMNSTNNNPLLQANWVSATATGNETPGLPNSGQNATWITGLNPNCGTVNVLQATLSITNGTCASNCVGVIQTTVTGGTAPYAYSWSNGENSNTISNLCPGTYTVTVTDASGCSITEQIVLPNGIVNVQGLQSNESCENGCDADILINVTGGTTPYTYQWSDGFTGASNIDICAGDYTLLVTDANGCTGSLSATIFTGPPITPAVANNAGPFTTVSGIQQLTASPSGGVWQANCGSCLTFSGQFNPTVSGEGVFTACYTVGTGGCTTTDCISIIVTEGCLGDSLQLQEGICNGDSLLFEGSYVSVPGNYAAIVTDQNGCDSIITLQLSFFPAIYDPFIYELCTGDSLFIGNQWIYSDTLFTAQQIDQNGCIYQAEFIVKKAECWDGNGYFSAPNVFTPNGDNVNDVFEFKFTDVTFVNATILNRWGGTVAELNKDNPTWNGLDEYGKVVSEGNYTYICTYQLSAGEQKKVHGIVTLVR